MAAILSASTFAVYRVERGEASLLDLKEDIYKHEIKDENLAQIERFLELRPQLAYALSPVVGGTMSSHLYFAFVGSAVDITAFTQFTLQFISCN